MMTIPSFGNKELRVGALRERLTVETASQERFDRISAFAAREFDVPIALISLVDGERLFFKSRFGMDKAEIQKNNAFCDHAIRGGNTLLVNDALKDSVFSDHPMVVGEPHVRFYAGALLRLENGRVAGTLCIMDRIPRHLDHVDLAILGGLRDVVVDEMARDLRKVI